MSEAATLVHRMAPPREGQSPHPALILLHGRGADEHDLLGLAPLLDPRFLILSARAPFHWDIGYCWYQARGTGGPGRAEVQQGLNPLLEFVDLAVARYPIDSSRIFLLGFSQGAFIANALTLTRPNQVAGAVLLSGFQPGLPTLDLHPDGVRAKPFFVAHGTLDPLLPVERGREVRDTLTGLGADLTYREYPMAHQITGPEVEEVASWLLARLDT